MQWKHSLWKSRFIWKILGNICSVEQNKNVEGCSCMIADINEFQIKKQQWRKFQIPVRPTRKVQWNPGPRHSHLYDHHFSTSTLFGPKLKHSFTLFLDFQKRPSSDLIWRWTSRDFASRPKSSLCSLRNSWGRLVTSLHSLLKPHLR